MKLIDKDALVAEIVKRKCQNLLNEGAFEEDIDILSFLDTLEVKEVENSNDAFVEKACSWLENNLQGIVGGSVYIEDFRKYMEGVRYDNRWNHV